MSSEGPLFGSELISPEVLKALPEGYSCRPLERKDYHNGFLDVLRVLTTVGDITEDVSYDLPLPFPPCPSHARTSLLIEDISTDLRCTF
jgi:hypothetical protein